MCLSAWICITTVLWNQSPTAYFLVLRFCGVFVCLDLSYNCAVESVSNSLLSCAKVFGVFVCLDLSYNCVWNQSPTAYFLVLRFCGVFVIWICAEESVSTAYFLCCAVTSVFISLLSSNAFEQVFPQIRSVTLHTFDLLFIISSSVKVVSSLCQLSQAVCRLIDQQHKATIAEVFVEGHWIITDIFLAIHPI